MADFSNYQEREERRRGWFLTAAAATAMAAAIPGVRKGAARLTVRALAKAGRRIGSIDPPAAISSSAAELKALLTRGIPEAARFGLGRKKAAEFLADELSQYGSTGLANQALRVSEAQAERILSTQAYRRFALQKSEARGLLFDDDIQEILQARMRAAQQIDPSLALDQLRIREQQQLLIAFGKSRSAFPSRGGALADATVQDALEFARQMAVAEFKQQAGEGTGFGARVARFFGIEGVQVSDPRLAGRLGDTRQQLIDLGIDPILAGSLPAKGFVQVGGELVDLTRVRQGVTRVSDWMSQHFQIPLGPGMMGITPTQLFPWMRGQVLRDFAIIEANAKDPALRAMLKATGQSVGKDVIQAGNRFMVADFEEGTLASLTVPGELRSGLYGYAKRRAEQIVASEEARAAGRRGPWGWLGLGQGYGESFVGKARSVFTKFAPDSTWAPRLFQRILTGEVDQISPREVRQLGRFLTDQELPAAVQQALIGRAQNLGLEPDLLTALGNVGSDQGVVDWFKAALDESGGAQPFMHSQKMRELVNHFRTSPRSALARFDPAADRNDLLDWNLFGKETGSTALQQMRAAIFDELESRVQLTGVANADAGFLELIDSLGSLSTKDRARALAYGQGKLILRRLEETDSLTAIDWLRQNQTGQGQIQEHIKRQSRFWQTYDVPEGEGLRTGELFIRQKYGFLEEYNRALKSGATWPGAMWSAVRGPWARQYGAFFTGRQEDVTSATLGMEYVPRKINEMLQDFLGLGLPAQDLRSGGSILAGLMLKRIFPVAAGYELYRYADYKGDEMGTGGPSDLWANLRSRMGLFRARNFGESIPLLGKRELFPGLEKILSDRTEEEEAEHQRTGREAVRKGRFWFLGSREEFWGGKIDYYLPSAVQVARSDWQGAKNVDLNTRAYWENSLIPLPENNFLGALNPLRRSDWWEQRHSMGEAADRPYLITGEAFDPNTLHGPLLNATIGRIIKPRHILRPEYLPKDLGGSASREDLRRINEAMKQGLDVRGVGLIVGGGAAGAGTSGGRGSGDEIVSPGILGGGGGAAPGSLGVITPGGQISLISMPMGLDRRELAQMGRSTYQPRGHGSRLSRREIEQINRLTEAGAGGLAGLRPADVLRLSSQTSPFSEEDLDLINFQSGMITGARNFTDLAGLYGWMGESVFAAAGMPLEQKGLTVASPSRAYGFGRRFYDLGLGGMGGPLSEVGRRFLTRPQRRDEYNPLPNLMPAWLPGPEYFIDFRHGDPYTKIARGELRLPGEAYERAHPEVRLMQTRASSLGKSVPEMMQSMLHIDEPMSEFGEAVTEYGSEVHARMQRRWKRMGVLIAAEQTIYNEELGISGHFDAMLRTSDGVQLAEIKTVGNKRFAEATRRPFAEHLSQINFYMHETGIDRGMLIYVNRDDPTQQFTHHLGFDRNEFHRSISRVQEARRQLWKMVDQGAISRGDLYDPLTRFEILSDVAPYSQQYATLRQYLVAQNKAGQLDQRENTRFQAAKKRVAAQKKRVQVTPYRFRNLNIDKQQFVVEKILDPNTIQVHGIDNPIRLAGVRSSQSRIEEVLGPAPVGMSLAEWQFAHFGIGPGSRITVGLEGDPLRRISEDTLQTMHAVVYTGGNLNRRLIEMGIGTEKETDYSDTGVAARFTEGEIKKGSLWEWFAHLDTPFHTKFLRVRSPLEELERSIVFGKSTGSWQHPFRDYISPTISSFAARSPIWGAVGMGIFSTFFFKSKGMKKKALFAGLAAGASLPVLRVGHELMTGETWKPARTRKREALEEYWDVLKYVKYRGLAAREEKLARQKEGVNVERMARDLHRQGERRKARKNALENQKRALILEDKERNRSRISEIQQELDRLAEPAGMMKLGPHTTRALQFRELYRSTLHGIDPGTTPFLNLFRAFPKYKRELIQGWIEKSDEGERRRIFQLLPRAEQRVLGRYLGIPEGSIPERPKLRDFFRDHPLPGPNWAGWSPQVDLEDLRMQAIRHESLDPFESGIYPVQIDEAAGRTENVPIPTIDGKGSDIQNRLNAILSGKGLKNVRVQVDVEPHSGDGDHLQIHMDLKQRREADIRRALQLS